MSDPRSRIPSVDALVQSDPFRALLERFPRSRVVGALREVLDTVRREIGAGASSEDWSAPQLYADGVRARLEAGDVPSLRQVVNATGVVLHTNLGRAALAHEAIEAMVGAAAYTNLEYDLAQGRRGSRYVHCTELLTELTGAADALVVNNAAAGLVLALNTLAPGRGAVVSRGELVEIGGGFRIPEVMERSGARLVEVGSTNRTRLADYADGLDTEGAALLLKVHRSNFRISGFTEEAPLAGLVTLGRERGIPLVYDLGSGLMVEPDRLGLPPEPRASEAIASGADVVVVSGDKLLGGPQAGLVVGRAEHVAAMRRNPLCRALRVDKVTLAGLEATLRLYRDPDSVVDRIPTLRLLARPSDEVREAAERTVALLAEKGIRAEVVASEAAVGGGTFPGTTLPSWAVALGPNANADRLAVLLRDGAPAVIGRIVDDRLLLDLRTVLPDQEAALVQRVTEAVRVEGDA